MPRSCRWRWSTCWTGTAWTWRWRGTTTGAALRSCRGRGSPGPGALPGGAAGQPSAQGRQTLQSVVASAPVGSPTHLPTPPPPLRPAPRSYQRTCSVFRGQCHEGRERGTVHLTVGHAGAAWYEDRMSGCPAGHLSLPHPLAPPSLPHFTHPHLPPPPPPTRPTLRYNNGAVPTPAWVAYQDQLSHGHARLHANATHLHIQARAGAAGCPRGGGQGARAACRTPGRVARPSPACPASLPHMQAVDSATGEVVDEAVLGPRQRGGTTEHPGLLLGARPLMAAAAAA